MGKYSLSKGTLLFLGAALGFVAGYNAAKPASASYHTTDSVVNNVRVREGTYVVHNRLGLCTEVSGDLVENSPLVERLFANRVNRVDIRNTLLPQNK